MICEVVSGRWFLSSHNGFPTEYGCLSILSALCVLTDGSNAVTDIGDTNLGDGRKGERQGLKSSWVGGGVGGGGGDVTVQNIWRRHKETQTGPRTVGGPVERSRKEDKIQERIKKKLIYCQKFMVIHALKARQ